jgi:hypothetical protein
MITPLLGAKSWQLLGAWLCSEPGATGFLLPKLIKLPLRLTEFLGAIEILQLFALVEFVALLPTSPRESRFAMAYSPP